ncbi:MAG: prepilin peptidase [Gammaproteobacteria bacterium]|nr:prepilin peptidase [Gammaproteobacteria bacterium]
MTDALSSLLQGLAALAAPGVFPIVAAVLGLIVGSFLNTVIHRLPRMLEREWREQCAELEGRDVAVASRYDLIAPRSHCPTCDTPLGARQLVPVLSWIALRGQCAACHASISPRYPLIELGTAMAFAIVAVTFGAGLEVWAAFLVTAFLIALAVIDFDTHYLPDQLTLPLLWIGLAASLAGDVRSAVIGAIVGYVSLWAFYHLFKLITGKEGMGYGDFKLFAALGVWLGPAALMPILLLASIAGAAVGLVLVLFFNRSRQQPIAFGPFLAASAWFVMLIGPGAPDSLLIKDWVRF